MSGGNFPGGHFFGGTFSGGRIFPGATFSGAFFRGLFSQGHLPLYLHQLHTSTSTDKDHITFIFTVVIGSLHKKWSFPLKNLQKLRKKLRIRSHLLKKPLIENFIFFVQCNKQISDSNFSLILIVGIFVLKRIIWKLPEKKYWNWIL